MGKRSDFERKPQDYYPTPAQAVARATEHLRSDLLRFGKYIEPCVGDGALRNHIGELCNHWGCTFTMDVEKRFVGLNRIGDATNREDMEHAKAFGKLIITNPPWRWDVLSQMLDLWIDMGFTVWVLLSADWAHNVRTGRFMDHCTDVVPVGRLKWEPDSKYYSKDNNAWYRFQPSGGASTTLHPRKS